MGAAAAFRRPDFCRGSEVHIKMAAIATAIDLVISFDTTGSMAPCLYQVRQELTRLTELMFRTMPARGVNVRIGVIAQGDYDSAAQYVTKFQDLTDDANLVKTFIQYTEPVSNSWNEGEAYEQALRVARGLTWRPDARRALVVVGDDKPHPADFPGNVDHVDWKTEITALTELDIATYAVQCPSLQIPRSEAFYKHIAATHRRGAYILLSQFAMVGELLVALLHHAEDNTAELVAHEERLISAGNYNRNMEVVFNTLLERPDAGRMAYAAPTAVPAALAAQRTPVPAGRFQRFNVPTDQSIKDFVATTGAIFKTGRGFYELSKTETVGARKEVILEHVASGEMFSGNDARIMLGLGAGEGTVSKRSVPAGHRAFIQSTSYNRKLIGGTSFLYEITVA